MEILVAFVVLGSKKQSQTKPIAGRGLEIYALGILSTKLSMGIP